MSKFSSAVQLVEETSKAGLDGDNLPSFVVKAVLPSSSDLSPNGYLEKSFCTISQFMLLPTQLV